MKAVYLLLAALAALAYALWEPFLLTVNETTVASPGVPEGFSGKRIAYASDIHCGVFYSTGRVRGLVDRIMSLEPDLIFLGGDYVTGDGGNIQSCVGELGRLRAPFGVYAVLGNHDNWADKDKTVKALLGAGMTVLDNRGARVAPGVWVGGVGDLWTETADVEAATEDASDGDYVILLSHNPRAIEEADTASIDLMLSGHTHGGQILPGRLLSPYLPGRLRQTMTSGRYTVNGTEVIVSKGVGTVFAPVRFMVKPEVNLITLERTP